MDHLTVAYVGLEVADRPALDRFWGEVIGLVPGEPMAGASTWRNDDRAHRVIVTDGPANDATFVGLEAVDDAAFDRLVASLTEAGHAVTPGTDLELATRRVRRLARVIAPWGVPIELVVGLQDASAPFVSPLVEGRFLTDGFGFGHVVFATPLFEEATSFLVDGLGFGVSDFLQMEVGPGFELEVRFFHCNGRHHSVALARAPFELPTRLHHVMVETNERDDVGFAFDRAWDAGLGIPNGLGRHDNDRVFSFYVASPAGFQVEVGHGGRVVTADWDGHRRYDRISIWGHQPLRQA